MESIEVNPRTFNRIISESDLEAVENHVSKKRKAKKEARKVKKAARKSSGKKGFGKRLIKGIVTGGGSELTRKGKSGRIARGFATGGISAVLKRKKKTTKPVIGKPYTQIVKKVVPIVEEEISETSTQPVEDIQPETSVSVSSPYVPEDESTPEEIENDLPLGNEEDETPEEIAVEPEQAEEMLTDIEENFETYVNNYGVDHVTKVGKFLRKAAKSKVLAVATGGVSKLGSKAGRKEVKKAAQKVGKVISEVTATTMLAPLLPLMPLMTKELKKKKVSFKKTPLGIAEAFYKNVVQKHSKANGFDSYDNIEGLDSLMQYGLSNFEDNIVEGIVSGLVKGIIEFIKNAKKKKESGQTVSKTEEAVIEATDKVIEKATDEIKTGVKEKAAQTVGEKLLFDRKTQLIVVGVVVLIVGIAIYMKTHLKK
jgi:hypothetical protein